MGGPACPQVCLPACERRMKAKHQGKFLMPKEHRMLPLNFASVQHPKQATEKAVHFPDKLSMQLFHR